MDELRHGDLFVSRALRLINNSTHGTTLTEHWPTDSRYTRGRTQVFVDVKTRLMDDLTNFPDYDRMGRFLERIKDNGIDVKGRRIADLGAGYGSLAIAAKRRGAAQVVAIDAVADRLDSLQQRASASGLEIETRVANLLTPFTETPIADVAFLIGVVEYAGLWDLALTPEELQQRIFHTAFTALEPGGTLIFASKNRWWPSFILRDEHTRQFLVDALPRGAADRVSRMTRGTPYREHIHSPKVWRKMILDAGFSRATCLYPLFNQWFPLTITDRPTFGELRRIIHQSDVPADMTRHVLGRAPWIKGGLMVASSTMGIPMTHGVVITATK
jgi:SAM-dependent methyltransferase